MPYTNPDRQKQAQHDHYVNNKLDYATRMVERRKERRLWFLAITNTTKCVVCPENHPWCIDFHHLNSKEKDQTVAKLLSDLRSKDRVIKEMEKCIPLCANCHRKHHAGDLDLMSYVGKKYKAPNWALEKDWSVWLASIQRPLPPQGSNLPD